MTLPNVEKAFIHPVKIRSYLLAADHPVGFTKAKCFNALGFRRRRWTSLHRALLAHARTGIVVRTEASPFGQKYVVDGILDAPGGRAVLLTSVWIVRSEEDFPRFVTAYPAGSP